MLRYENALHVRGLLLWVLDVSLTHEGECYLDMNYEEM